ncbi:hypothetical protein M422DRAFT_236159 [Sphaerobolus stellatus SS14]|uniref:Uncharacterized protein n=1 Tax=Sphaerobolus stellatus (strain SS14) TaxID=990650 RepID=A0A0C9UPQ5_SPHS4|nr:hypothetical protein M422DRAFT_236159 [Sphaerobolus stellatus SS14]
MVRFKNRWLLVEFIPCQDQTSGSGKAAEELNSKHVWLALKQSIVDNFGDVGWGSVSTSLNVKYFSPTTNLCIIRVARDHHRVAWGAMTLLTSINGREHIPHIIHLAGTIKQAQLAAIKYNREIIARYRSHAADRGKSLTKPGETFDDYLERSEKEIGTMQD